MDPGILKVIETEVGDVEAHSVKIGITVEGEDLLYGSAALEKCAEVKKAVERFKAVEPQIGIYVRSVLIRSDSGWFSKSSKGAYRLDIVLKSLGKMNEVLGIILDMPNVSMNSLEWVFDEDQAKIDLIKKAMAKAKRKAEAMTSAVGHKIVGIRACSDSYEIPNVNVTVRSSVGGLACGAVSRGRAAASVPTADMGTEITAVPQ